VTPPALTADPQAEIRRLTRLAKSPGVISNLVLAGEYHAQIFRLREQIKQQKAATR
jgi:hypothetical protein